MIKKNKFFLIIIVILFLFIVSYKPKIINTDKEIYNILKEELDTDVDLKIIDSISLENKLLVIYMADNEYGYAEFNEKNDGYKLFKIYEMYERGIDLRSAPYNNSYLFVVNNEQCEKIQILQNGKEHLIEVKDIPFVYFLDYANDFEYNFLNSSGENLNP